jgi:hypothetical protein
MADLAKYTLQHNKAKERWELIDDGSGRVRRTFETKEQATRGGALAEALGKAGGSVKVRKLDGTFQEERTFPRSADPRGSKG